MNDIRLKCLNCGKQLERENDCLSCSCGMTYPIINNIPRFTNESYTGSFSMQWRIHSQDMVDSKSGLDIAERMFFERAGLSPEELKGKLILDAGCGNGRFLEVLQKYGANVIGVDMSDSVEQAYQNIGSSSNVQIMQADILNLPFFDKTFDIVFSIGVIHHTSDCHRAFSKLAKLVKPNGKLAVWVYSNDGIRFKVYNTISNFYRVFTTRMPPNLLYKLCYISIPLYYVHKIPLMGYLSRAIFISSDENLPRWRVLSTFDWYSPKYQSKHTYRELESWFQESGFGDIRPLVIPVSMVGVQKCR